jgi:hypothetical protein
MSNTISIDALATALNQQSYDFSTRLNSRLRTTLELESELPFQLCESGYTGQDVTVGDLIQPYQSQFTPRGTKAHDGVPNVLRPVKIDKLISAEELEKFFTRMNPGWFTPDPNQTQTTYLNRIFDAMTAKWIEELNLASWAGQYVAPTPGTPGAILESVDGFDVSLSNQITAGRLVPITTGAMPSGSTEGEVVDYVRDFVKAIPEPYRYAPGMIFMSKTNAQKYADDYQAAFPSRDVTEGTPDVMYLRVDHFNKTIKGVTAMEGSDRMVCVFNNLPSMIIGSRTGYPPYFQFRFETEDRNLKMFAEIYRFYGFETCLHLFVNDQAGGGGEGEE